MPITFSQIKKKRKKKENSILRYYNNFKYYTPLLETRHAQNNHYSMAAREQNKKACSLIPIGIAILIGNLNAMKRWRRVAGASLVSIFIPNQPSSTLHDQRWGTLLRGTLIGRAVGVAMEQPMEMSTDRRTVIPADFRGRLLRARFCELVFSAGFDNATARGSFCRELSRPVSRGPFPRHIRRVLRIIIKY